MRQSERRAIERLYTGSACARCGRPFAYVDPETGHLMVSTHMQFRPDSSLCDACEKPAVGELVASALPHADARWMPGQRLTA